MTLKASIFELLGVISVALLWVFFWLAADITSRSDAVYVVGHAAS
jgi:hypothetical protein